MLRRLIGRKCPQKSVIIFAIIYVSRGVSVFRDWLNLREVLRFVLAKAIEEMDLILKKELIFFNINSF